MLTGDSNIPPIDSAALPPEVRNGTPEDRQLYSVALGFERMLVEQLTQQLTDSASLSSSDGDGSDSEDGSDSSDSGDSFGAGSASIFTDQLPGAFADAITNGGGLGLAAELYQAIKPASATSSTTAPDVPAPAQSGAASDSGAAA